MSTPTARAPFASLFAAALAASFAVGAAGARAESPHPFTVEDLVAMDRVTDPAVSPDGARAVFVVSALDLDGNRRRNDLWTLDLAPDGASGARDRAPAKAPVRLTTDEAAGSPAFSRDGAWVYYLSARGGAAQVHRVASAGGAPEPVTRLPLDVSAFRLAPDGHDLVVAVDVFPECGAGDAMACTKERLAAPMRAGGATLPKASGRVFDRLFIRHWDTWSDGRRTHLFALALDGAGHVAAGARPVDLLRGMDADCPSKPFGDVDEWTFTPDSRAVVFSARDAGRAEAWSTNFDLYLAPLDGSAAPRDLTPENAAWDTSPLVSRDGRRLFYLAMSKPGYESDRRRVMVRDLAGGPAREIAPAWDRSPEELTRSPDDETLYATADDEGRKALFAIDVASGRVRALTSRGHASSPRVLPRGRGEHGDRLLFARDDLRAPAELFAIDTDGHEPRALTRVNAAHLAAVKLGDSEPFTFAGWNGETVHGFVVKPVDFDPQKAGRRYPVAFLVHGGPQGSFDDHFHYRWNPQIYAGAGYGVVMIDFHGSTGYGQRFTDSIAGDWGGKPLEDLQKGLAAAVAKYPFLDGDDACALGASFGGFMINWIAGAWPDRFRCLVSHDGNLDERAAYFDTEELWFPEHDHGGTPWANPAGYARHNPVDLVDKWKTPMLVIHGGRDFRVVDTQGMSTFTALQRRGVPSRFLYFPDENHWVVKPQNSVLWHHTVLDWLDRFARPRAAAK